MSVYTAFVAGLTIGLGVVGLAWANARADRALRAPLPHRPAPPISQQILQPLLDTAFDKRRTLVLSTDPNGSTVVADGHAPPLSFPADRERDAVLAEMVADWNRRRDWWRQRL